MVNSDRHIRPLRFGMVGGGRGSQIGDSHRIAARLDGRYQLVAGAFDVVPERGRALADDLGLEPDRAYDDFRAMAAAEAERADGVEIVSVVTPNSTHYEIARAFLERGIHVICEKPLATSLEHARDLHDVARRAGAVCAVMYGYSGYPLVRQARRMVAAGELGRIRVVQAEFAHGGMAEPVEQHNPSAAWRLRPEIAGPSFVLGDAGTHAHHLATYITGHHATEVAAEMSRMVPGRQLEDNAHVLMRFDNGATGFLWASAIAVGNTHGLRIRVYGEKAGLEWQQEHPNQLRFAPLGAPARILERDTGYLDASVARLNRISAGHPEGYFEAFGNVYRDVADVVAASRGGPAAPDASADYPSAADGVRGVRFLDAAVESAAAGGAWTSATVDI